MLKVWSLVILMWTVPTVEDGGSYHLYRTDFATFEACEASLAKTLKTATPHMTAICRERVISSRWANACEETIGWMKECPEE